MTQQYLHDNWAVFSRNMQLKLVAIAAHSFWDCSGINTTGWEGAKADQHFDSFKTGCKLEWGMAQMEISAELSLTSSVIALTQQWTLFRTGSSLLKHHLPGLEDVDGADEQRGMKESLFRVFMAVSASVTTLHVPDRLSIQKSIPSSLSHQSDGASVPK